MCVDGRAGDGHVRRSGSQRAGLADAWWTCVGAGGDCLGG